MGVGKGNDLRLLREVRFPHSLGLFYSALTAYLGFEVNEGEYKVMGLAGFGQPRFAEDMIKLFKLRGSGGFRVQQGLFDFVWPETLPFTSALTDWLGPAREPESVFHLDGVGNPLEIGQSRRYADVAASAQKCTEEVVLHVVRQAMSRTGLSNVCLAGGVALNSVANGRLQRELGCQLYVQPASGD